MAPNKKLTVAQFQHFFTPWWYAPKRMVWDHKYVSIQPVPTPKPTAAPPKPAPTVRRPATRADRRDVPAAARDAHPAGRAGRGRRLGLSGPAPCGSGSPLSATT